MKRLITKIISSGEIVLSHTRKSSLKSGKRKGSFNELRMLRDKDILSMRVKFVTKKNTNMRFGVKFVSEKYGFNQG